VPKSELAAAAAAATAEQEHAASPAGPKIPVAASSPNMYSTRSGRSSSFNSRRTSAGGELRSARQTLLERDEQLQRVSQRSREMNDSAVNFAAAAQGFLELSQKKKR